MAAITPAQIVASLSPIVGRTGAAGIAGNLMQESSDNPADAGGGLAQWQGSRYSGLLQYAHARGLPATSAQAALGYLVQDLKGPYSGLAQQLRGAQNPAHAADLFSNIYERPGIPMLGNRERYAQQALGSKGTSTLGASLSTFPGASGASGQTRTVTSTGFNQGAYNADQRRYIAGSYLANQTDPYKALEGKTGLDTSASSNPLIASGQLLTTAPDPGNPAYKTTTTYQTAQAALQQAAGNTKVQPHPAGDTSLKGVTQFGGKAVAKWIAPILAYARQHGWQGSVTSGYRTLAQQKQIYDSGVRPAAVPGTSNHEMTAFPGGAVDVSDAQQLSQILLKSPYARTLVYAGSKDPVHFSHPHNGSY